MCTVSFYSKTNKTIITSNRDEHYSRAKALPPQEYIFGNYKLIFCKDAQANGTWMALRSDSVVVVLLNGAFEKHTPKYPYRKSRGLVLLDIMKEENCLQKFNDYDFTDIEPFTIILFSNAALYECIWNGIQKYVTEKSTSEKHIWSSATLYENEFRIKKQDLFQQLIQSKKEIFKDDILDFHHSKQDLENGFIINRNEQLLTFSVTQIVLEETKNSFYHHDIKEDKEFTLTSNATIKESVL